MPYAEFLERARNLIPADDYETLSGGRIFAPEDGSFPTGSGRSPLLGEYLAWEIGLRNELVKARAQALGKTAERFLRPGEPGFEAARIAHAAVACDDPLEAELLIERERWALIDRLETGHYFDLEALVAYGLKLQALERRARFQVERGEAAYTNAYESILAGAGGSDDAGILAAGTNEYRTDRR